MNTKMTELKKNKTNRLKLLGVFSKPKKLFILNHVYGTSVFAHVIKLI